ncbi:MAG: hypothetical protein KatS3mg131_0829 [Candidatus Tectimicrobiota bacterium]|nr:MAG: hypothetical protein KatS3mg131_0829 [Candidatus Tectomicrobia bacterium]
MQGAVVERVLGVMAQGLPLACRETPGKAIRIKRGAAGQGQDLATARIEGHDGARLPGQQVLGQLLQGQVQGEDEIRTRLWRVLGDDPGFAPESIDFHLA